MASFNEGISLSIGRNASNPKTSWKGVKLVAVLAEVRYAQRAEKRCKWQFNLYFPTLKLKCF